MSDVRTPALLLTKLSLDEDSGFRHDIRAEVSLPLTQSAHNSRVQILDETDCIFT